MIKVVASVERDGVSECGTTVSLNRTEATQISLSIDGIPIVGIEFDVNGVGVIGWFPPDWPDTWVELGRFETGTSVTDNAANREDRRG